VLLQARQQRVWGKVAPLGRKALVEKKLAAFNIAVCNTLPRIVHILADIKPAGKGRGVFQQGPQGIALAVGVQKTQSLGHAGSVCLGCEGAVFLGCANVHPHSRP